MTTMLMDPRGGSKKSGGCGCGGGSECCEIECLVQPRFFCGQLLADQDLTALVDWVKAKSALVRFRDGWGVACGLEVTCADKGGITVKPGYAVDCCGRDVLLCEPKTLPLPDCWQYGEDRCSPLPSQPPQPPTKFDHGPIVMNVEEQVFDIYLRYSESQSDSRSALGRGGCGGEAGCEYSRVNEGAELYCVPVPEPCTGPPDPLKAWEDEYRSGLERVRREVSAAQQSLEGLIAYLRDHPPSTFCFLREWLCSLRSQQFPPVRLAQAAAWIVQDWRIAHLSKGCSSCGPDSGIRLARVWVGRSGDSDRFTTLYIKSKPPYRRLLSRDDFRESREKYSLAPLVWENPVVAKAALAQRNIAITIQHMAIEQVGLTNGAAGAPFQEWITWAQPSEVVLAPPLVAISVEDPICGEPRIVHFKPQEHGPIVHLHDAPVTAVFHGPLGGILAPHFHNLGELADATPEVVAARTGIVIDEAKTAVELARRVVNS